MSLTLADVSRLEHAGWRELFTQDDDGYLRLRTVEGRCLFLDGDDCRAYPDRPEGCVLYPLIFFEDPDQLSGDPDQPSQDADQLAPEGVPASLLAERTGLDDFCPYRHEFSFSEGDRAWLCRSIAREEREVAQRRLAARR